MEISLLLGGWTFWLSILGIVLGILFVLLTVFAPLIYLLVRTWLGHVRPERAAAEWAFTVQGYLDAAETQGWFLWLLWYSFSRTGLVAAGFFAVGVAIDTIFFR